MPRILIDYSDGRFSFREYPGDSAKAKWSEDAKRRLVEVPEPLVEMWRAVLAADEVMQRQLAVYDNLAFEQAEKAEAKEK